MAVKAVFNSWNADRADPVPAAGADPGRPRHRGQHRGHGLRQPRHGLGHRRRLHPRPRQRPAGRLRRLPAERAGRGRRGRHPQHGPAAGPRADRRQVLRRAHGHHGDAGEPLQGPVRHRVHDRARQAVDAADPGRQAHRRGRVPDRHAARRPGPDRHGRGADPGDRQPARAADVPAVRRQLDVKQIAKGISASPGAAVGKAVFDSGRRGRAGRGGRARHPGPARDQPGRPARHDRCPGHPDQPRRQDQPRGGGRPRHGQDLRLRRGRARGGGPAKQFTTAGGEIVREGDVISIDGTSGVVYLGEVAVVPSPVVEYFEGNLDPQSDELVARCTGS